jgi:hypothetical protein
VRNVRPSYVNVAIDGRSNTLSGGPQSRLGTLHAVFFAREKGESIPFLDVTALASDDGQTVRWIILDRRDGRVLFDEAVHQ